METAIHEKKKELVDKYSQKLQQLNAKGILPPSFNHVRVTNMMRIEMARTRSEDLIRKSKKNSKRMKSASAQQSSPSKQLQNTQDDFVTKMNTIFDAPVETAHFPTILSSPEKPSTSSGVHESSNFTTPTKRPSTVGVAKITPTKSIPKISFNWMEESFSPSHWTNFLDDCSLDEPDSDNFRAKCTRICEIIDKLIVVLSKEANRNSPTENSNEIVQVLRDLLIGSLRTLRIFSDKSKETWIRGAESLFASLIEGQSFSLLEQESIHQLAKYFVNTFFSVQSDIVLLYNRKRDEFSDELYHPILEQLKRSDYSCLTDTLFIRWRRAIAKVLIPKVTLFSEWTPLFEVEQHVKRGRIVQLRNLLLKNLSTLNLYTKDESDEKFRIIQKCRILYIIVLYVGLAEKSFGDFFCNILQIEKVKYISQLMDITLRAMNISPSILPKQHPLNNDPFWNIKFFEAKKKETTTNTAVPILSKSIEFSSSTNLQDRKSSNAQFLLDKQLSSLLLTKDSKLKDYKREIKERTMEGSRMGSFKTQLVSQQQQALASSISRQSSLRQSVLTKQSNEWVDWNDEEEQLDKVNIEIEKELRQLSKKYLSLSEVKNHQLQQEQESIAPATRQIKTKEGILNEIECKELFYRLEDIWTKLKNNYNINLEYYNFYLTFVGNITLMKDAYTLWKNIALIIERREQLVQKWKRLEQGLVNSKLNSKSKTLSAAIDEQRRQSLKKQLQYLSRLVEQASSILKRVFRGDIRYCNELYLDRVQQEETIILP